MAIESLRPVLQKARHKCPFYGFAPLSLKIFSDQKGNRCSLIITSYNPCQMEAAGQTPDWQACPLNNQKTASAIQETASVCKIFPNEFKPEGQSSWSGIPFKQWMDYVMSDKVQRP